MLGKADCAGRANALDPRGDIDAVAHQVAVGLLDDVAQMNADAELDASLGRQAGVALDHAALYLDRASHRVDDAAKLYETAVASSFDDTAVACGDCWVDEVAAQRPEPGESSLLVRPGEPAITDNICNQDRSDLPGLAHGAPSRRLL